MRKHYKFLLLSATVLISAQGIISGSDAVFANEKKYTVMHQKQTLPKVPVTLKALPNKYSGQPFKDISHSIYKKYIHEIYKKGITTGYTPTTFNPEGKVNRGEMAIFLYRLAGSPSYNAPFNVFTDIKGLTNQKQILWLSATRITSGTGLHYDPHGKVTRGQMAAFLHRMAVAGGKAPASGKYDAHFIDAKKHMFANDIGWLRNQGITTGYTPTSFKPDASVSRGEMAAFIYRFYNKFNAQSQPEVDKTNLKVKDSTLFINDRWKAQDNFVSATDKTGKIVNFSQVKVSGNVDTSKAGIYTITYTYGGKTATAKVTVKEDKTKILLKKTALTQYIGMNKEIQDSIYDNILELTNQNGQSVLDKEKDKVKLSIKDNQNKEISIDALSKSVGTYTVSYNYYKKSVSMQLTISDDNLPKLSEDGKTVQFMNKIWSVIRNMGNGNYIISAQAKLAQEITAPFKGDGNNDVPFFEGDEKSQDGYLNSNPKKLLDLFYDNHIKDKKYEVAVLPVCLPNPTLEDMINLGILKSNTINGSSDNFYKLASPKYRTTIDEFKGTKQAFLLSAADLSDGTLSAINSHFPALTPEALAFQDSLKHGISGGCWLRSPGQTYNKAGYLSVSNLSFPVDYVLSMEIYSNIPEVVPSLAVHID